MSKSAGAEHIPPTEVELEDTLITIDSQGYDRHGVLIHPNSLRRYITEIRRLRTVCEREACNVRNLRHPYPSPAALDFWTRQIVEQLLAASEGK